MKLSLPAAAAYVPDPPASGFKFYKLVIESVFAGNFANLCEVMFYDKDGQVSPDPNPTTSHGFQTNEQPFKLVDNNNATLWTGNSGSNISVTFSFPEKVDLTSLSMRAPSATGSLANRVNYCPKFFRIEGSEDGSSWHTLIRPANAQPSWGSYALRTFYFPGN